MGALILSSFLGAFSLIILARLLIWAMDRQAIVEDLEERGARTVDVCGSPFLAGWFGRNRGRFYEVIYVDATGNRHSASCLASFREGVQWTEIRMLQSSGT